MPRGENKVENVQAQSRSRRRDAAKRLAVQTQTAVEVLNRNPVDPEVVREQPLILDKQLSRQFVDFEGSLSEHLNDFVEEYSVEDVWVFGSDKDQRNARAITYDPLSNSWSESSFYDFAERNDLLRCEGCSDFSPHLFVVGEQNLCPACSSLKDL